MGKDLNGRRTAYLVCHTHWDREWYLTREEFRLKLVRLLDRVLDLLERDESFASFMMDGQTIALEDYLQIRPENARRLSAAIRSGRLLTGPWYVLPDELIVSGESHVRNYLTGRSVASPLGGAMGIGYLPDSFGHPEQMPQIIQGLGLKALVFWRGVPASIEETEFYLESAHKGTKVLCIHLPFGYGNSARLEGESKLSRLDRMIGSLKARSKCESVLLMSGSDHIFPQENLPDVIREYNARSEENRIVFSSLPEYVSTVIREADGLAVYHGEMRSGDRTLLLGSTLSTRIGLKLDNHAVQKTMERYLEPMDAYARVSGINTGFEGFCEYLWKKILENHPHDSICGCSTDAVHEEMATRFACVAQLQQEWLHRLSGLMGMAFPRQNATDAHLLVFEPTKDRSPCHVKTWIDLNPVLVQDVNFDKSIIVDREDTVHHPDLPIGMEIRDDHGRVVPHVVLVAGKAHHRRCSDGNLPEIYKVNRFQVSMLLPPDCFGVHLLTVAASSRSSEVPYSADKAWIENEAYRVDYSNCDFTVLEKRTGLIHSGVGKLVDKGDAGDEYTYSWPKQDRIVTLTLPGTVRCEICSLYQQLTVETVVHLPAELDPGRGSRSHETVPCRIKTVVTLHTGSDVIDFELEVDNRAKDHRLQVEFPSGIEALDSASWSTFAVTRRDIGIPVPENWMEYPQSTHPTHGYAEVRKGGGGVSVISPLPEYEAENMEGQTVLRLTLLRCVGWLSRTDLLTRKGNGGWTLETPGAQCLGIHRFQYGVQYGSTDGLPQRYKAADRWLHTPFVEQLREDPSTLSAGNDASLISGMPSGSKDVSFSSGMPSGNIGISFSSGMPSGFNAFSFLSDIPQGVALSSVRNVGEKAFEARVFSIAHVNLRFDLVLPDYIASAFLVNLAGEVLEQAAMDGARLSIAMEPGQIKTLRFQCG